MIITAVLTFIAVVAAMPVMSQWARRVSLLDKPDERKQHEGSIPLVGGITIFSVYIITMLFFHEQSRESWPFWFALLLLVVTGAMDDKRHIRPWIKFSMQGLAALLVVFFGGAVIDNLGNLFSMGDFYLGFMAIPFSLAAVMLLINAINLIDGLDGLAGGIAFIMMGWLVAAGNLSVSPLMGAVAGFLVYNLRTVLRTKASVFLGDAGSMGLGLCLAWFSITMAKGSHTIEPISVAWILAVPVMDECAQFYRRVRAGRHPFSPDRGHFHHHFIDAGYSPGQATCMILFLTFLTGAIGVVGISADVPQIVLTLLWIFLLLLHMVLSDRSGFYVRSLENLRKRFIK